MRFLLIVPALLLVVATALPLIRADAWWIRAFDFPRLQILVLGLLVLAGGLFVWDLKRPVQAGAALLLALAVLFQAYKIFPYTPLAAKQVRDAAADPDTTLSLLVANVLMSNRAAEGFLEIVRASDPDLVLTLEPDAWWENQLRVLEAAYPYTVKAPLDNRYGMLLYARLPLIDPEIKYLVKPGIPSVHAQVRLPSGRRVWFHGLHPEPPAPAEAETTTPRDAELLLVGRDVEGRRVPTIVAGDLNDVAWSYTTTLFQKISGLLDPRRGRGLYNTFHAQNILMRWPLDHVFHSEHFTLVEMRRMPAFGSDHFPIFVHLRLEPGAEALHDPPTPDPEEVEEVQEKIDEADPLEEEL